MSWENIYYNPEKFGLIEVAEISWSDESYQFDLTVVWRQKNTGKWFVESDSGCSCPSPFESVNLENAAVYDKISAVAEIASLAASREDSFYSPKSHWQPQVRRAIEAILGRGE